MRLPRVLVVAAAVAMVAATSACGSDNKGETSNPKTVDKVSYATSFGQNGREAYAYVAKEKGFFTEAGLDVTITPGAGTGELLKQITGGRIDFAPVDSTGYLLQVGGGQVKGVTGVAAIQQRSLAGLMTLEGRGINTPKDLEGKKIGEQQGGTNGLMFPTYAKLAGIDASKVTFVNVPAPQLAANLASGSVDVIGQFVVGKPTIEKAAGGKKAIVLPYSDFITDLYGNVLVTTEKMAKEKPDLVKRFRDALLKGLKYAIENPEESGRILNKYAPTSNAEVAAEELKLMAAYVTTGGSGTIGALDSQRVARCIAILQGANAIPAGLTPEKVVSFDLTPKS